MEVQFPLGIQLGKYGKIIALFSTIGWLAFVFSAFKGFHFWYAGFVIFLWLALGSLNYNKNTSLWLFKNKLAGFLKFFLILATFSFGTDYLVFQKLVNLWTYPHYNSIDDWIRLYLVIYPFGGLSILELVYFLGTIFQERLSFVYKRKGVLHKFLDKTDQILLLIIFFSPFSVLFLKINDLTNFILVAMYGWAVIATLKFKYHIGHWLHYIYILIATFLISIFLHEIPNIGVFEWKYNSAPFWNLTFLGIPFYIILGWYILVLIVLRMWMYFVLKKGQD